MNFKTPYNSSSIFTEVMTGRDKQTFELAYRGPMVRDKKDPLKLVADISRMADVGVAREWVSSVLHLWAEKLPLNFALAVQVFQTGDTHAVVRHYARILTALNIELQDMHKIQNDDIRAMRVAQVQDAIKQAEIVTNMDTLHLNNWLREQWVWALTLTHTPSKRVNSFSGKLENKVSAPKQVVDNKAAKPVVAHRSRASAKVA